MNSTIKSLHEKAIHCAKEYLRSEKELLNVLIQMEEKRAFLDLGYTGIFNYCLKALFFSESQASYFSSVARKSKEVPALKEAIDQGVLSVSKARRIIPVITNETQAVWIERAATLPQKELEREVAAENPRVIIERLKPVDSNRHELRVGVSDEVRKKWERAISLVSRKKGEVVSMEETLEEVLSLYLSKKDPVKKAERNFPRKEVNPPSHQGKRQIPKAILHQVNLRDRGQCTVFGCTNSRFVEVHHKLPLSKGGSNELDNLTTLCSAHHKITHREFTCASTQGLFWQERWPVGRFKIFCERPQGRRPSESGPPR